MFSALKPVYLWMMLAGAVLLAIGAWMRITNSEIDSLKDTVIKQQNTISEYSIMIKDLQYTQKVNTTILETISKNNTDSMLEIENMKSKLKMSETNLDSISNKISKMPTSNASSLLIETIKDIQIERDNKK